MKDNTKVNGKVLVTGSSWRDLYVTIEGSTVTVLGKELQTRASIKRRHKGDVVSIFSKNFTNELKREGILKPGEEILTISAQGFEFDANSNTREYIEEY